MGWWGRLFGSIDSYDPAQRVLPDAYEPFMGTGIPVVDPGVPLAVMHRNEVEAYWASQPNLRKVVGYIARNVASIPLKVYERVSDTEREQVRDHALTGAVGNPAGRGGFRFWESVISDGLLYDRWCVLQRPREDGSLGLVRVPAWRLKFRTDILGEVTEISYWVGDRTKDPATEWKIIPLDMAVFDYGYAPRTAGLTPIHTLRDVLQESAEAVRYRREVWENGTRAPGFIKYPGRMKDERTINRLRQQLQSAYGRDGDSAGGLPLLEDGMEIVDRKVFTPQDAQDLTGRQLTAVEVAAAYHIAPELVGAREGTYSNIEAFRQMAYRDNLGPYIVALEDALNAQLVPGHAAGRRLYVEAHVETKLRGSFEEQAKVKQAATGAPWLTRNEARAMENRPPVPGGDELVTPLNVLIGGQASPQDSVPELRGESGPEFAGFEALRKAATLKARADMWQPKVVEVLERHFARQRAAVLSKLGAKADDEWWDAERWNRELADDLFKLGVAASEAAAKAALDAMGVDPGSYDLERTLAWLRLRAEMDAQRINDKTRDQVSEQLDADDGNPADVFDQDGRAAILATAFVTALSGFGTQEAGKQSGATTKTWVTTSSNPRPSHAALNGVTVPIGDPFPNGLMWPGDAAGGADELAGCECAIRFDF